jgi:hypothetical protein
MRWYFDPFSHVLDLHSAIGKKGRLMVPLLSRSVHKFCGGVAIRKDTWRGSQQRAMIHFNMNVTASTRRETFS